MQENEKHSKTLEEIKARSRKVHDEWPPPKSYEEGKKQLQRLRGFKPRPTYAPDGSLNVKPIIPPTSGFHEH